MKRNIIKVAGTVLFATTALSACSTDHKNNPTPNVSAVMGSDGTAAPVASIDRFSDAAGHLQKRSAQPSLPAANAPVNFDQGPFITKGFGPEGQAVSYYNFDVQPLAPAPIYVLFKAGATAPIDGQFNIVGVIPGDTGYNDFWNIVKVTVPDDYQANQIKSVEELQAAGYATEITTTLVNCPIVPAGSTATLRYNGNTDTGLHQGWYKDSVVTYFNFSEKALALSSTGTVPLAPIYVSFNKNPAATDPTSGPASGFKTDPSTGRTHNVVESLPEAAEYSPLWNVDVYDDAAFGNVDNLATASGAPILAKGVATVNCPIVSESAAASTPTTTPAPTPAPTPVAAPSEVQVLALPSGPILATAQGLSLYTYDVDKTDVSNCYDSCAVAWPPLVATAATVAAPYSIVTRTDGSKQLAYNHHPLYRYVGDGTQGDISGDAIGGVWHLAKP